MNSPNRFVYQSSTSNTIVMSTYIALLREMNIMRHI